MISVLTDRGRAVGAAGATLLVAGWLLGFADIARLGGFALTAVAAATLLLGRRRPPVEIEGWGEVRSLTAGERVHIPLRVVAAGHRFPTLTFEQSVPGGSPDVVRGLIPGPASSPAHSLDLYVTFRERGRHTLPPPLFLREDPFGFASRSWSVGASHTVTVLPRWHPLDGETAARSDGIGPGSIAARRGSLAEDSVAMRVYTPGDDLRRIHWPATAHRGQLMTRHEERGSTPRALVALDPHLATGSFSPALEWAIEMAASVCVTLGRADRSVELLTVDGLSSPATATSSSTGPALLGAATPTAAALRPPAPAMPRMSAVSAVSAASPMSAVSAVSAVSAAEEFLHVLAMVPTSAPRAPLRAAAEDPFLATFRERAATAGLVVLLASGSATGSTTGRLFALPPGCAGVAILLHPNPRGPEAAALRSAAATAGWSVSVCSPEASHLAVWQDVTRGSA